MKMIYLLVSVSLILSLSAVSEAKKDNPANSNVVILSPHPWYLKLTPTSLILCVKETATVKAEIVPSYPNDTFAFPTEITNAAGKVIASVTAKSTVGKGEARIRGVASGTGTMTVSAYSPTSGESFSGNVSITVIEVERIEPAATAVCIGDTVSFEAVTSPSGYENKVIINWEVKSRWGVIAKGTGATFSFTPNSWLTGETLTVTAWCGGQRPRVSAKLIVCQLTINKLKADISCRRFTIVGTAYPKGQDITGTWKIWIISEPFSLKSRRDWKYKFDISTRLPGYPYRIEASMAVDGATCTAEPLEGETRFVRGRRDP